VKYEVWVYRHPKPSLYSNSHRAEAPDFGGMGAKTRKKNNLIILY
jgi:hypothetical protein